MLPLCVIGGTTTTTTTTTTKTTTNQQSQTSVDSVSLFVSDLSQVLKPGLSQAVSMLDSVIGVRSGVGTVHVS